MSWLFPDEGKFFDDFAAIATRLSTLATLLEQASANCQLRFNRVFLRGLIERLQSSEADATGVRPQQSARPEKPRARTDVKATAHAGAKTGRHAASSG